MSKEKRRVPKLRFPGFTEDWEQRKFGEIYERAGQKNDLTYGIDKIISVANMYFKIDATVGSEEYLKTYNVFKLGDIAFEGHTNKEHSYGRFVENTIGDGIVSHIFDVFTPKINLDINFWKELIKYEPIMGPILRRCTKASRMMSNLTSKEFLEEKILCPTLEEQKLIGEFIVRIDKNITLHQRKLEHLNLKKKALLQKLFPKNGERYPELRFPGVTDAWEQRKFGEIYERAGQKNDLTYGIDKIISVANMYFKIDATVGSEEYLKTYNVFKLGDIAFEGHTNKEHSYGRFVENTIGDGIVSHIFDVFTPKINLDINFWKELIKYEPIMGPILRRCTKASRMMSNLTSKEFLEEKILCPTLEEQKLIGEFIVRIDKNITLHQRKLEHLQLQKKALLQQMFV